MPGAPALGPARLHAVLLFLAAALAAAFLSSSAALPAFATGDAPSELLDHTPRVHAFENARLVIAPGRVVDRGTLVIRDGLIEGAGADVPIPADAARHDAAGLTIYPGLIDLGASFGVPDTIKWTPSGNRYSLVRPELDLADWFGGDAKVEEAYRKAGFTTVLVNRAQGIFRGRAALYSLAAGPLRDRLIARDVAMDMGFDVAKNDSFPESLMGAIALTRQTFLDAAWYRDASRAWAARPAGQSPPEADVALEALQPVAAGETPLLWQVTDEWNALRAAKLAAEAGAKCILLGSGYEYRRLDAVKALGLPVVVPLAFPRKPDVSTADEAAALTLTDLRHFVLAPSNAGELARAGVRVALTARGLEKPEDFRARVREAIESGLAPDAALAALTTVPAELIGQGARRGTLEKGKAADFILVEGDLFDPDAVVRESWIGGKGIAVMPRPLFDPRGDWRLRFADGTTRTLRVTGTPDKPEAALLRAPADTSGVKLEGLELSEMSMSARVPGDSLGLRGAVQFTALAVPAGLLGRWTPPEGAALTFDGTRMAPFTPAPPAAPTSRPVKPALTPLFPSGAFGRPAMPPVEPAVLVKNATIWTEGPQGTLHNADLLVKSGKIAAVGPGLAAPPGAKVIDATGRHVSPGIIDCHSHIAVSGEINEGTTAVSAMVRIGDVLNPDDIAIYRQLAGGVTMSHPLHGSANPIGGQCEIIKMRWGALPDELKMAGAPPTIKFALGENVKQSNWGDKYVTRYPQSRMGVEAVIRDAFQRARDYQAAWAAWKKAPKSTVPPRRDLALEALGDVLDRKLFVHVHSYRQDEILMLIRVADDFGFHIACFQHGLEAYKVAEAVKAHGATVSCFADWWSYKFEVYDAIAYAGAITHDVGIVTSFNSDSAELARRLNVEAAKAMKYGGMPAEDALALVTLNPAKQMYVADRVGSLEPGKDADFVIWNGPPLSSLSRCEETWVDGRRMFDRDEDAALRRSADDERQRIVQYILALPKEASK